MRSFYGAKAELLHLINEVSDLRLILNEIDYTVQERGQQLKLQEYRAGAIVLVLKKEQAELTEIDWIIDDSVLKTVSATGRQKVGRIAWTRQKSKLKRLQLQLKDTRLNLSTLCSNATL